MEKTGKTHREQLGSVGYWLREAAAAAIILIIVFFGIKLCVYAGGRISSSAVLGRLTSSMADGSFWKNEKLTPTDRYDEPVFIDMLIKSRDRNRDVNESGYLVIKNGVADRDTDEKNHLSFGESIVIQYYADKETGEARGVMFVEVHSLRERNYSWETPFENDYVIELYHKGLDAYYMRCCDIKSGVYDEWFGLNLKPDGIPKPGQGTLHHDYVEEFDYFFGEELLTELHEMYVRETKELLGINIHF